VVDLTLYIQHPASILYGHNIPEVKRSIVEALVVYVVVAVAVVFVVVSVVVVVAVIVAFSFESVALSSS